MAGQDSRKKLADWRTMYQRGRSKIMKASRDPSARAKLLAEISSLKLAILRMPEPDRTSALLSCPAYLQGGNTGSGPTSDPGPSQIQKIQMAQVSIIPPRSRYSFLTTLPPEIRNMIYGYAIGYPSSRKLYDYYYEEKEKARAKIELRPRSANTKVLRHPNVSLRTPTVLLLCKQITREALSFLHLQTLVIDRIPPWVMGHEAPLSLLDFISKRTMQNVRFAQIKIPLGENDVYRSGKVWQRMLDDVLNAWSERNSLVRLQIMFKISNVTKPNLWLHELDDYEEIVKKFSYFEFKHGLKPGLIRWEHWVLDFEYAYRVGFRNPLVRVHPDPYIWQGSVFEWL
ncbi:uncharacterized protein F4822DRAFT_431375 [Hypoxylon trugodes]|uniref:uncharacterized protein n=1 Tax=Hypoxylon trugodes TaxID=326681 RepID=UPI002197A47D|nr:uncharacterized protein F4822DRAFT_431375 [Hypoxylon trugodes]KAI1386502.1 hypothetical protein F4822DRAFT_431375 [Hypoxylon trugodes]